MYYLEQKEPYKMNGIGNTKQAGVLTYRWKQLVVSEDKEALINYKNELKEMYPTIELRISQ